MNTFTTVVSGSSSLIKVMSANVVAKIGRICCLWSAFKTKYAACGGHFPNGVSIQEVYVLRTSGFAPEFTQQIIDEHAYPRVP